MLKIENLILGAGIAGLGAGYRLQELKREYLIIEKDSSYGGLCGNFRIDGFLFDRFVHLSFTNIEFVRNLFDKVEQYRHKPYAENYYHGIWLKHPAQNNLYPLDENEKTKILQSMLERKTVISDIEKLNYEEWLRYQFGDYFAENFSMKYTKKYWGIEAKELETKWIGSRIYQPSIEEVKRGMMCNETGNKYYAKEMRYPKLGGFKAFLQAFTDEEKIRLNEEVIRIDEKEKIVYTNLETYKYERLYSSIPLPQYKELLNCKQEIKDMLDKLYWTSAYIISLGFEGKLKRDVLWYYIYDDNIFPARIYSPSKKSSSNCPLGKSSIQAEIYFKNTQIPYIDKEAILAMTIAQLNSAGIIDKEKIVLSDIRYEKYANIIFDYNIYSYRRKIKSYLNQKGIITIGRFGEWDYFWSDQSFMSGYSINV